MILAQTGVQNEEGSKPTLESISKQLAEHLGNKEKADSVIHNVLLDLNKHYDDQTVIPVLQEQVDAMIGREKDSSRVDAIVKKLTESVGSE